MIYLKYDWNLWTLFMQLYIVFRILSFFFTLCTYYQLNRNKVYMYLRKITLSKFNSLEYSFAVGTSQIVEPRQLRIKQIVHDRLCGAGGVFHTPKYSKLRDLKVKMKSVIFFFQTKTALKKADQWRRHSQPVVRWRSNCTGC